MRSQRKRRIYDAPERLSLSLDVLDRWLLPAVARAKSHLEAIWRIELRANGPEVQRVREARNAINELESRYEELRRLAFWLYQAETPNAPAEREAVPVDRTAPPKRKSRGKGSSASPARRSY